MCIEGLLWLLINLKDRIKQNIEKGPQMIHCDSQTTHYAQLKQSNSITNEK